MRTLTENEVAKVAGGDYMWDSLMSTGGAIAGGYFAAETGMVIGGVLGGPAGAIAGAFIGEEVGSIGMGAAGGFIGGAIAHYL